MFKSSMLNAEEDVRNEFLDTVNNEIHIRINNSDFKKMLRERLGSFLNDKDIIEFKNIFPNDPLYSSSLPATLKKEEHYFAYCLIYQAIRCASLLHDIGHPPFSHVAEYALKDVYDYVNTLQEDSINERQRNFLGIIKKYISSEGKIDLHEKIGNRIADRLLESIIRDDKETIENNDDAKQHLFYLLVNAFTTFILEDKKQEQGSTIFEDVHRIIDGSIDCDRLDYVTRDTFSSNANKGKIEYDRLIGSMKLLKGEDGNFTFCFDMRTLSSIEDFFTRRWQLYKYTIFHHRVIKTDALLGKAIFKLSLDYLDKNDPDTIQENKNTLPLNISGLWRAFDELFSDSDYFDALIQWDDSWLLTVLRQQYFSKYRLSSGVIKEQLEELLSNRKNYYSLIKRMDDFYEIDSLIVKTIKENPESLLKLQQKISSKRLSTTLIDKLCDQVENYKDESLLSFPIGGFFLYNLMVMMESVLYTNIRDILKETIEEELKKHHINDIIITFKQLTNGLEKKIPYIYYYDRVVNITNISNIKNELEQNKSLYPVFFAYLCGKSDIPPQELRSSLGRAIGNRLFGFFDELQKQL